MRTWNERSHYLCFVSHFEHLEMMISEILSYVAYSQQNPSANDEWVLEYLMLQCTA